MCYGGDFTYVQVKIAQKYAKKTDISYASPLGYVWDETLFF